MPSSSPPCPARGGQAGTPGFSVDLAAAARRLLAFLRAAPPGVGPRSVQRYHDLWMPLVAACAGGGGKAAALLSPRDVHLVWLCHCFHHESYVAYCRSRFGRLINRPLILDLENEEYAEDRCHDVWSSHYPSEPFDLDSNEMDGSSGDDIAYDGANGEIVGMVRRYAGLAARFASPFIWEGVYHVAAKRRYIRFLDLINKVVYTQQGQTRLLPSLDILLMWLAHQSFPASYATDMASMAITENVAKLVVGYGEVVIEEVLETTRVLWEDAYDEPYDMAGSEVDVAAVTAAREAFYWEPKGSEEDANRFYKSLQPRFLMETRSDACWLAHKKNSLPRSGDSGVWLGTHHVRETAKPEAICYPGQMFRRQRMVLPITNWRLTSGPITKPKASRFFDEDNIVLEEIVNSVTQIVIIDSNAA